MATPYAATVTPGAARTSSAPLSMQVDTRQVSCVVGSELHMRDGRVLVTGETEAGLTRLVRASRSEAWT